MGVLDPDLRKGAGHPGGAVAVTDYRRDPVGAEEVLDLRDYRSRVEGRPALEYRVENGGAVFGVGDADGERVAGAAGRVGEGDVTQPLDWRAYQDPAVDRSIDNTAVEKTGDVGAKLSA